MSFWSERFNAHALWEAATEARSRINEIKVEPTDREGNEILAYIGQVIELLELRRSETPAQQVTLGMLDRAASAVSAWAGELANVVGEVWSIHHVVDSTDAVQDAFASWPVLKPSRYLSGIQSATDSFIAKIGDSLDRISVRNDEAIESLEVLTDEQRALSEKVAEERQRVAELIAELKISFNDAAKTLIAEQQRSLDKQKQVWSDREAASAEEAEFLLSELRRHEETAKSTVHATTAVVVATDYGKYARNKNLAAWICDVAAALVGAAGVTAILYHLFTLDGAAVGDVGLSVTRLAASLGTLGIAALIGRRGAQHHRESRAAKRTDLALRRVGPFIVDLPREEQEEIVLDLTERVFIRGDLDAAEKAPSSLFRERIGRIRAARSKQGETSHPDQLAAAEHPDALQR